MIIESDLSDVALSTRSRAMRNLDGRLFTHKCSQSDLQNIMREVIAAIQQVEPDIQLFSGLTMREREEMVAHRLISTNFPWSEPGRAVLVTKDRKLSIMVNEEDHLRVQVLEDGFASDKTSKRLAHFLQDLSKHLKFAHNKTHGYLASSYFNSGRGTRHSVMLHLVALGYDERLPHLLQALVSDGITIRGLYGEGSRPVGAYAQVSTTSASLAKFVGSCEYLIERERKARRELGERVLEEKAAQALLYLTSSPKISLLDAFRVIGSLRWAASAKLKGYPHDVAALDAALASVNLMVGEKEEYAEGKRADKLRRLILG